MENLRVTDLIRRFCSMHRCAHVLPCSQLVSASLLEEWTKDTDHDLDNKWTGNYGITVGQSGTTENVSGERTIGGCSKEFASIATTSMSID
jgi:hypothetical protein